jgi:hypothetical protein
MSDDHTRGLYHKWRVTRLNDEKGKHAACDCFVLDLTHDPFAEIALKAYINACRAQYPLLASDLLARLKSES